MGNIHELYDCLQTVRLNYDDLLKRCASDAEKTTLADKYRELNEHYQASLLKEFDLGAQAVVTLQAELHASHQKIAQMIRQEKQFAEIGTVLITIADTASRLVDIGHH